jgi:ABC-type transporter Mla MlaB component
MKRAQTVRGDPSPKGIEPSVELLNVNLELFGDFDRDLLLRAWGEAVVVVSDDDILALELNDTPDAILTTKLSAFVALVRALPKDARQAWDAAAKRVFNIGIQSGLKPHCTYWTIPTDILASVVEIRAEAMLTIYGAE